MTDIILYSTIFFFIGFLVGALIFQNVKKNGSNEIYSLLLSFKNSLDEYKNQSSLEAQVVKDAILDASKLAKILTQNQNLKGQFAEDALETVLSSCYPDKNIHYIKQFISKNEDEKDVKPDFVVNLPDNHSVVIDCKLNIDKFIAYKENDNHTLKLEFIKDINSTVNNLANKKYQTISSINQPDFILMYTPIEAVVSAIYTDKDFSSALKNANDKNIIIVGTSGILTVLKLVNLIWTKNLQEKNIDEIIALAQNIYELIAQHSRFLFETKTMLEENSKRFNREYEKISQENKLFKSAQALKILGIQATNKKEGKKLSELNIHDDFINNI